jgi:hypothetical protein
MAQSSSTLHFDGVFEDVEIDTLSDRPLVCHDSLLSREAQLKVKGASHPKRLPLSKKLIYISIIE